MNKGKRGLNSPLKVGRPSLYKEEYGQMLIDHLSKGGFVEGFSMKINVTDDDESSLDHECPKCGFQF